MTDIDLSIIIPAYNRISLLKDTLRNVNTAIEGLKAEIILIDDGSFSPLINDLNEFKHLPIKFYRQHNSGLNTTRYNGLLKAGGKFIQFLDSDDLVHPSKFKTQINEMEAHNADVSYTDFINFYKDNTREQEIVSVEFSSNPADFYIKIQPAAHSPIYRRSYILGHLTNPLISLTREYDYIGEVWMYYNLAPFQANIIKVNEPLTIYIHHTEERLSTNWEQMGLAALKLMKKLSRRIVNQRDEPSQAALKNIGILAFQTYRGLPKDIYSKFQLDFINIWKLAGKPRVKGGKYYNIIKVLLGQLTTAKFLKYISKPTYRKIKTMAESEFIMMAKDVIKVN